VAPCSTVGTVNLATMLDSKCEIQNIQTFANVYTITSKLNSDLVFEELRLYNSMVEIEKLYPLIDFG